MEPSLEGCIYYIKIRMREKDRKRERLTEGGNSMKIALEEEYSGCIWQFMGVEESLKRYIVGSSGKKGEEKNSKL